MSVHDNIYINFWTNRCGVGGNGSWGGGEKTKGGGLFAHDTPWVRAHRPSICRGRAAWCPMRPPAPALTVNTNTTKKMPRQSREPNIDVALQLEPGKGISRVWSVTLQCVRLWISFHIWVPKGTHIPSAIYAEGIYIIYIIYYMYILYVI